MIYQYSLRFFCFIYVLALKSAAAIRKKKVAKRKKLEILITGTFYSDNWLITHLKPLAMSDEVAVVRMVSVSKVPDMENVVGLYPPDWMTRTFGKVPSRLLYFCWLGLKTRPDYIGGFHLLLNGLVAVLLARILGSSSMYICGGGPREVSGGGIETESKIFNRLKKPDAAIEGYLLSAVNYCDLVIVMGHGAADYFRSKGITSRFEIVPGGFDALKYSPREVNKKYDLILVGRLSKVKRVDIFLEAIAELKKSIPEISAVIVGDGPDSNMLKELAGDLRLDKAVHFAGWQDNVEEWLAKSKIFVLTSESEGLSQALIQAMMTGLPAVVTDIGDLSDLVVNETNGYLIDSLVATEFANAFHKLLAHETRYKKFCAQAYSDTRKYSYDRVAKQWDSIFQNTV